MDRHRQFSSKHINIIADFFNEKDKSIIASLPSDFSVNYFINENSYVEFAKKKLLQKEQQAELLPFIFRFSIEHFMNFLYRENISIDLTQIEFLVDFPDFKIQEYTLNGDRCFLILDESFAKEDCGNILIDCVVSRYYIEDASQIEKIYLLKNNKITGFFCKIKPSAEGFFLMNMQLKLNPFEKMLIFFKIFKTVELMMNSNLDYYDIDFRSLYILQGDHRDGINILNKKVKFDRSQGKDFRLKKIQAGLVNLLKGFFILFSDNTNIQENSAKYHYKADITLTNEVIDDLSEFISKMDFPENLKLDLVNLFKNSQEIKNANEFLKMQSIVLQLSADLSQKYSNSNLTNDSFLLGVSNNEKVVFADVSQCAAEKGMDKPEMGVNSSPYSPQEMPNQDVPHEQIDPKDRMNWNESCEITSSSNCLFLEASKYLTIEDLLKMVEESDIAFKEAENDYNEYKIQEAAANYEKCYLLRKRALGINHKDTAVALTSLAGIQLKLGLHQESLKNYLKVMDIYGKVYGEGHILLASICHNIGLVYDLLNLYDNALECYNKALKIKLAVLGEKNQSTASTYYNIGGIYDTIGEYSEALKLYLKAISIYNSVQGEINIDTATAYNNVGLVYDKLSDPQSSIKSYNKSIAIATQIVGEIHPLTATSYNNLGLTYFKLNNISIAIEKFEQSIRIREKLTDLGFYNLDTASSYNNLAGIYFKQEEYSKAYEKYAKCLEIYIKLNGDNTPETATAYNNIGLVCAKMKSFEEGLTYFKKAYDIRKRMFGEEHFEAFTVSMNIAGCLLKQGNDEEAIKHYLPALNAYEKLSGKDCPEVINLYSNLGHCYGNLQILDKSLNCYEKGLEISLINFGEKSLHTAGAYLNLHNYFSLQQKNRKKAKRYLKKCIAITNEIIEKEDKEGNESILSKSGISFNLSELREKLKTLSNEEEN